jgi:hypothetical protein
VTSGAVSSTLPQATATVTKAAASVAPTAWHGTTTGSQTAAPLTRVTARASHGLAAVTSLTQAAAPVVRPSLIPVVTPVVRVLSPATRVVTATGLVPMTGAARRVTQRALTSIPLLGKASRSVSSTGAGSPATGPAIQASTGKPNRLLGPETLSNWPSRPPARSSAASDAIPRPGAARRIALTGAIAALDTAILGSSAIAAPRSASGAGTGPAGGTNGFSPLSFPVLFGGSAAAGSGAGAGVSGPLGTAVFFLLAAVIAGRRLLTGPDRIPLAPFVLLLERPG